jgi:hypothetical protein
MFSKAIGLAIALAIVLIAHKAAAIPAGVLQPDHEAQTKLITAAFAELMSAGVSLANVKQWLESSAPGVGVLQPEQDAKAMLINSALGELTSSDVSQADSKASSPIGVNTQAHMMADQSSTDLCMMCKRMMAHGKAAWNDRLDDSSKPAIVDEEDELAAFKTTVLDILHAECKEKLSDNAVCEHFETLAQDVDKEKKNTFLLSYDGPLCAEFTDGKICGPKPNTEVASTLADMDLEKHFSFPAPEKPIRARLLAGGKINDGGRLG